MKLQELLEADWSTASETSLITKISQKCSDFPDLIQAGANITDAVIEFTMRHCSRSYTTQQLCTIKRPDGTLIPISDNIMDIIVQYPSAVIVLWQNNYKFTPTRLKQILSDTEIITSIPEEYNNFVKFNFKNNTLLMNKWLRYANNIKSS